MATRRSNRLAAIIVAGGVLLAGLPTAGLAFGSLANADRQASEGGFASLTPASVDPRLAAFVAKRTNGDARLMRFTPAGVAERGGRSVTVAVRVDENAARAISVRNAIGSALEGASGESGVKIASSRYNLGISRGYQNFAKPEPTRLTRAISDAPIPDLADMKPAENSDPSRFATRIELQEQSKAGAAPRTIDSRGDQTVDIAGSYRLTRNLNVTAGVRYSQERDRLAPVAPAQAQDNQAVYVGTQFSF